MWGRRRHSVPFLLHLQCTHFIKIHRWELRAHSGNGELIRWSTFACFHSRFSSDPGGSDNENVSFSGERATAAVGGGGGVNRSKSNSSPRVPGQSNESTSSSGSSARTGVSGSLSENHHHHHHNPHRQRSRSSRSTTGPSMGEQQNGRILGTLLEQINLLHETNSKICRNLHDTKGEWNE